MVLEGGSTLLWPLWLHARHAGTVSINSAIYYESDIATGGLKYRTVRMTHTIHVSVTLHTDEVKFTRLIFSMFHACVVSSHSTS